jgi:DNA-binding transcriptional MerR regulator
MKTVINKKAKAENRPRILRRKSYYSINELAELFGVNDWTIRLWVNRFKILTPHRNKNGTLLFTPEDAKRIGTICNLSKAKDITLRKIRKYFEAGGSAIAA